MEAMRRNKLTLGAIHDALGKRFCVVTLEAWARVCPPRPCQALSAAATAGQPVNSQGSTGARTPNFPGRWHPEPAGRLAWLSRAPRHVPGCRLFTARDGTKCRLGLKSHGARNVQGRSIDPTCAGSRAGGDSPSCRGRKGSPRCSACLGVTDSRRRAHRRPTYSGSRFGAIGSTRARRPTQNPPSKPFGKSPPLASRFSLPRAPAVESGVISILVAATPPVARPFPQRHHRPKPGLATTAREPGGKRRLPSAKQSLPNALASLTARGARPTRRSRRGLVAMGTVRHDATSWPAYCPPAARDGSSPGLRHALVACARREDERSSALFCWLHVVPQPCAP